MHQHEGAEPAPDPDHALADRAGAAVILQQHRRRQPRLEDLAQARLAQRREIRMRHQGAVRIEIGGQGYADAEQPPAIMLALGDQGVEPGGDRLGDRHRCGRGEIGAARAEHLPGQIEQADLQIGVREVHADREGRRSVDHHRPRRLAALPLAGGLLDHQADRAQLLHHLRDRRPREAGRIRDLGPRRRAVAPQRIEHAPISRG